MGDSVWVVSVDAESVLSSPEDQEDPLAFNGVRVLWMHEVVTTFDDVMLSTEPFMDAQLRSLIREEAEPITDQPAQQRLLASESPHGSIRLLSLEQFRSLQIALRTALEQAELDLDGSDIDDFDELTHVRPAGDFVTILA